MKISKEFGPYEEVLEVINQVYEKNNYQPIPEERVKQKLRVTPGLFFSPGTTWDDILTRMHNWKWISRIKPVNLEEVIIIPLKKMEELAA